MSNGVSKPVRMMSLMACTGPFVDDCDKVLTGKPRKFCFPCGARWAITTERKER